MAGEIDMEAYQKELTHHLMLLQQQQAAPQKQVETGGVRAATAEGREPVTVTGCQNATVQIIIKGDYTYDTENHDKPVYRKTALHEGEPVLIYFWDERDGEAFSGWWFGPKVGGDQVWAYNAGKDTAPPMGGWKVPYAGPIDPSLQIIVTGSNKRPAESQSFDPEHIAKMARTATQDMASVYQQAVAEQQAMQQATLQEQQAAQQKATSTALEMRKIIQKVRMATPENFADLKQELQEALQKDLVNCGAHMSRIKEEAQQVVDQMQAAVQQKLAIQAAEEEKRRQEEEARKLEEQKEEERKERTAELLKEIGEKVVQAEIATEDAEKTTKEFLGAQTEEETTKVSEKVLQACSAALTTCQAAVDFAFETKFECEAAKSILGPTRVEAAGFQKRIAEAQHKVEQIVAEAKKSKEKWVRKEKMLKFNAAQDDLFKKYDTDKDGGLNRKEIEAFAKGEFAGFEIDSAALDKVLKKADPQKTGKVSRDMFYRLRTFVGMESEILLSVERKVEAEKRKKLVDEQKAAIAPLLKAAVQAMAAAEKAARDAEQKAGKAAGWKRPNPRDNLLQQATEAVEATAKSQELLEEAKVTQEPLKQEIIDEQYKKTIQIQLEKLAKRAKDLQPKITQTLNVANKAKEHQEKVAEQNKQKKKEQAKNQCLAFWRTVARDAGKESHDLLKETLGDTVDMDEDQWLKFFQTLNENKPETSKVKPPTEENLKAAFEFLAVSLDESITKVAATDILKLVPAPPPKEEKKEEETEGQPPATDAPEADATAEAKADSTEGKSEDKAADATAKEEKKDSTEPAEKADGEAEKDGNSGDKMDVDN